jgi:hypothetical protein
MFGANRAPILHQVVSGNFVNITNFSLSNRAPPPACWRPPPSSVVLAWEDAQLPTWLYPCLLPVGRHRLFLLHLCHRSHLTAGTHSPKSLILQVDFTIALPTSCAFPRPARPSPNYRHHPEAPFPPRRVAIAAAVQLTMASHFRRSSASIDHQFVIVVCPLCFTKLQMHLYCFLAPELPLRRRSLRHRAALFPAVCGSSS